MIRAFFKLVVALGFVFSGPLLANADEVFMLGASQGRRITSKAYQQAVDRHIAECKIGKCDWVGGWDRILKRYPGQVSVRITRTLEPITLVLTGNDSINWTISTAPGVKIKKIIMSGYYRQMVNQSSNLSGVKVRNVSGQHHLSRFFFSTDDRELPVSLPDSNNGGRCSQTIDPNFVPSHFYSSELQSTLDWLDRLGIKTFTGIQGKHEAARFVIGNGKPSTELKKSRSAGYCYQNRDGTIVGGWPHNI